MPRPEPAVAATDAAPAFAGDRLQCLARVLPEILALATMVALALGVFPALSGGTSQELMQWVVMTEGATAMFLCTVVDVATRLRRAPPWWAGLLGCGALLALYPEVPGLILSALQEGLWVALPFAWSVLERLRELWTLPGSPRIEKLRRRALTFGRLYTGLIVAGTYVLTSLVEYLTISPHGVSGGLVEGLGPWFLATFFGLAAFDAWRVHRPAFAARPGNLWPRFDGEQTASLDPL